MENGGGEKEWRKEKGVRSSSLRKHRGAASSSLTKERALSIRKHSGKDFIKPGTSATSVFSPLCWYQDRQLSPCPAEDPSPSQEDGETMPQLTGLWLAIVHQGSPQTRQLLRGMPSQP